MINEATDYELFLKSVISGVSKSDRNITSLRSGLRNRLKGISGQSHQIDVSFIDRSFDADTLVLIECKCWKEKVSVDVSKILTYNAKDITNNPDYPSKAIMIIVATSGFQEGTRRIAKYEGIRLHTVNHGPPFSFDYENIIFIGARETVAVGEEWQLVTEQTWSPRA